MSGVRDLKSSSMSFYSRTTFKGDRVIIEAISLLSKERSTNPLSPPFFSHSNSHPFDSLNGRSASFSHGRVRFSRVGFIAPDVGISIDKPRERWWLITAVTCSISADFDWAQLGSRLRLPTMVARKGSSYCLSDFLIYTMFYLTL